jgi:enoyl-CoA hydratase/carnithine racemase
MSASGVEVERRGAVAWILINDYQETVEAAARDPNVVGVHEGVGLALDELRWDASVRLIVLTGRNEGEFYRFSRRSHWDDPAFKDRLNPLRRPVPPRPASAPAVHRRPDAHELLITIEKPVIARVNGDAIGFGMSLLWACDMVVAREDARIAWGHTGLGRIIDSNGEARGFPWSMTPSYGSVSLLAMSPAKANEWMMLSKVYTGRELADMNVINYAVPAAQLDETVERLVADLLERPDAVLRHTKRLVNKQLLAQYNLTEDLANAFSGLDLFSSALREGAGDQSGS